MTEFSTLFMKILTDVGLSGYATPESSEKFESLADMLVDANEKFNLTAITDAEGIILRHFADCLTAAGLIGGAKAIIDVGCGGGFPTLPLAIAASLSETSDASDASDVSSDIAPSAHFIALDSTAKKLGFVAQAAEKLDLPVSTLSARAEEIGIDPMHREQYDLVISRAVARLNILAELCLPLARVGGRFVAMKGASGAEELAEAERGIAVLGGRVRFVDRFTLADAGERVIIEIEKVAPTPSAYPRPFGKIKKKPL